MNITIWQGNNNLKNIKVIPTCFISPEYKSNFY